MERPKTWENTGLRGQRGHAFNKTSLKYFCVSVFRRWNGARDRYHQTELTLASVSA